MTNSTPSTSNESTLTVEQIAQREALIAQLAAEFGVQAKRPTLGRPRLYTDEQRKARQAESQKRSNARRAERAAEKREALAAQLASIPTSRLPKSAQEIIAEVAQGIRAL